MKHFRTDFSMDVLQAEVGHHACLATWHSLPLEFTGGGRCHDDFVVKSILHRINVPDDFRIY